MRAHVTLEVEVSKDLILANLEEARKLNIRVDLATILLVLKSVLTDILVDITGHISAGHLSARGLGKESSELVTDASRLNKTTGGAGASLALALGASLLGSGKSASPLLLKTTELGLKGSKESTHLLKLHEEISRLGSKACLLYTSPSPRD